MKMRVLRQDTSALAKVAAPHIRSLLRYEQKRRGTLRKLEQLLPQSERVQFLFSLWAPLYDIYWRVTGHEDATCDAVSAVCATEGRIFCKKRVLDVGTGTGILPYQFGFECERRVLLDMVCSYLPDVPRKVRRLAHICLSLRDMICNYISDPKNLGRTPDDFAIWLRRCVAELFNKDKKIPGEVGFDSERDYSELVSRVKAYDRFGKALHRRATLEVLIESEESRHLAIPFLRDAMLCSNLIRYIRLKEKLSEEEVREFLKTVREIVNDRLHVVGIDLSPEMLEIARRKNQAVYGSRSSGDMFRVKDAKQLSSEEGKFDYIVFSQFIQFFTLWEARDLFRLFRSMLNKDGRIIVFDEWTPVFSGRRFEAVDEESSLLESYFSMIESLFHTTFIPMNRADFVEGLWNAGFSWEGASGAIPIGEYDENHPHVLSYDVFHSREVTKNARFPYIEVLYFEDR